MILSMILIPFFSVFVTVFVTVVTVGNPARASPRKRSADSTVDKPRALSPEVEAKVDDDCQRDVKLSTAKEYKPENKKIEVNTSSDCVFQ